MKYYIMLQDKRMQHKIKFREFPTEKTQEFGTDFANRMKWSVTLHVQDNDHTVYGEVIEAPCYMVSKKVHDVIKMFEPEALFSNVVFSLKKGEPLMYKVLLVDRIDVLHEAAEFHKDHSVKRLILDKDKIGDMQIFRIKGISPNYIVVSMAIAESIIRRNCVGITFREIEVLDDCKTQFTL